MNFQGTDAHFKFETHESQNFGMWITYFLAKTNLVTNFNIDTKTTHRGLSLNDKLNQSIIQALVFFYTIDSMYYLFLLITLICVFFKYSFKNDSI